MAVLRVSGKLRPALAAPLPQAIVKAVRLAWSGATPHKPCGRRSACPVFANGNGKPMTIIRTILLALVALVAIPAMGQAQPFSQYEKASFDKLVKSGKPVVVHVHADW